MRHATIAFTLLILFINSTSAETFEESENKGLNKAERLGLIEKHLVDLTREVKDLEAKNAENTKTIKELDAVVKKYKEQEQKINAETEASSAAEKNTRDNLKINEELKKLKEDVMSLKNQDIEQMQELINALRFRLDNIEKTLKISVRP
ncbi:MAG: hypothetical protein HOP07_17075 [Bacteriovoracaceae bacterium]|nr:hypothetical protein [Bacteriovoracaceae bacterium]